MKWLSEEGRLAELNQYKISEELDWEENDIALPQFAEYAEYCFNSMYSHGASIHKVDLNEDGISDVIEYLNCVGEQGGKEPLQTSLTIYLGNPDGSYEVAYYRPYFDTFLTYEHTGFFVIQYKGERYFVFDYYLPCYDPTERMVVYLYQENGFVGKLVLSYEYSELIFWDKEGVYCKEAKELAERWQNLSK